MLKFKYPQKASKTPNNLIYKSKKGSSKEINYQKCHNIITQVNKTYLNNFIQQVNPRHSALTPTNHSKIFQNNRTLLPKKSKEYTNKKTLLLDLDETLAHSSFIPFEFNDAIIKIEFESILYNIYVLIRPGAVEFIKKVAKLFEVVLFTASIPQYALQVIDIIDTNKNIKYKLTRQHCTFLNGIYIKELKKLDRDLSDIIILDNSPLAYSFDNDNGLPIKAWYEDRNDNELDKIYTILEFLSKVKDVRNYIKKFVNNNEIDYDVANEIIKVYKENLKEFTTKKTVNKPVAKKQEEEKEKKKEIKQENQTITVNIHKQNYLPQAKTIRNDNNKENNNINVKTEEKLMKNNVKTNKGIFLNNKSYIPNYLKKLQDKNEKSYNYYFEKLNLANKNTIFPIKKSKNKEININSIIKKHNRKKNAFLVGSWLEKIRNKNSSNTNSINNLKNNNLFSSNKANINSNENENLFYSTFSKISKDFPSQKETKITDNFKIENNQNSSNTNNRNSSMKNRISSSKDNSFNYNKKYNTLMEKLEKKIINSNYSLNYKRKLRTQSSKVNNKKIIIKNKIFHSQINSKGKLNHVGSFILNQYKGFAIKNPIKTDGKSDYKSVVVRSKSTGNFINFYNIEKKSYSAKRSCNFEKKLLISPNEETKYIKKRTKNFIEGFPKIIMHKKNLHY